MTRIRPFQKDDIAEVVALRGGAFRSSEQDDEAVLGAYFAEVFFGNPWYDETLPSLVCEDDVGRVVGFLGVVPRRMTAYGVPLRVATTTQFMVAPSAPALVGSQLLRTLFDGPQGFSLADVASAASRPPPMVPPRRSRRPPACPRPAPAGLPCTARTSPPADGRRGAGRPARPPAASAWT